MKICYFLKIRMCAQMRRSPGSSGAEPCTAADRASPGRVRRPFVPGPLEAGPRQPSRRARPRGAHTRARAPPERGAGGAARRAPGGCSCFPGPRAPEPAGEPRAPRPTEGGALTQLLRARGLSPRLPFLPFSKAKRATESPRGFVLPPLPAFSVLSLFSVCFPSSVASGDAAGRLGCAWPRASRPRPGPE